MNLAWRRLARMAGWMGGAIVFASGMFYGFAAFVRPDMRAPLKVHAPEEIAAVERLRDTSVDRAHPPTAWRDVEYPATPDKPWYPTGEPEFLAELVRDGLMPPVAERVGEEPLVLEGPEGIGSYGGTWHRILSSTGDGEVTTLQNRLSGPTLVRWSPQGYPIVPHVAKSWEISPDNREFTFHLRRGMKWSDGHPFTADDFVYGWYDDLAYLGQEPLWMRSGGRLGRLEKIDDYAFKIIFDVPNGTFIEQLCNVPIGSSSPCIALPAHYFRKFHPRDGDPELIRRYMRELRLASPAQVYKQMKYNLNPECPRIWPFVYRTYSPDPPFVLVRNPYYFAVDPAGNQLPYLDRLALAVKPQNQIDLAATLGEITFQARHVRYEDYTLLMDQRDNGGYDVYHWVQGTRSTYTVFPNLNRRIEPGRPETRLKHEFLNQKEFRQALSLALNRREIIRAEYNDQTEPAQIDPGPASPFFSPRLFKSFVEYDPARARALLDSIGLTRRDAEGMRTFPDGTRMTYFLETTDFTGPGPAQMLIDDWQRVGVRVVLRDASRSLWQARQTSLEHDLSVWTGESDYIPMVQPRNFVPTALHSFYAAGFGLWYLNGGNFGDPRVNERPGAIEPPADHPLRRAMELYDAAAQAGSLQRQVEIFSEIQDIAAENVWSISICTPPPQLVIVKRGLRNVPHNAITGTFFSFPANAVPEVWWLENANDPAAVVEQTKREMVEVTPEARQARAGRGGSNETGTTAEGATAPTTIAPPAHFVGRVIRWLIWGTLGLALVLVAVRHPFIGRRLMLMVPTLAVISVIVFVIIQLPPGDYATARILEWEMTGDSGNVALARDLEKQFYLDRPMLERFARWMGMYWFTSFSPGDTGLLQGNLGRSMENSRLVNDIVGDRILLTVAMSVFTILFTWCLALPTGIYSAVRQYSLGDYVLTFLGFIGVCIPNFLFALVLIHVAQQWFGIEVSGLFSAEYAIQPDWTWGKFVDLLQHIWVPVVVLGVGGTAGMIRIMRGNLLDELRKPYVTTARAKGVRPLRLLLKYPVRLALNPFISGIGALFPQLVSGGAIVSMVLALPTVGPMQLSALLVQDMYLAGSMLMVLSLLGVLGTLVSDLLLLALDPRIRLEGGTR